MSAITTLRKYATLPDVLARYTAITSPHYAQMYISECLIAVSMSRALQSCTPQSIITSSLRAATMGLHLDLDEAYLVPYKDQCTLITGYKGMRNLAMRTGLYHILHAGPIDADWTVRIDPITGLAAHTRETGCPAGACAYFLLTAQGGRLSKTVYMTLPEVHAHAAQYSRSYTDPRGPWRSNPRSCARMEIKTVFRRLMLEWGIMSPIHQALIATEETQSVDETLPPADDADTASPPPKKSAEIIAELL